jgi:hypothetical protein
LSNVIVRGGAGVETLESLGQVQDQGFGGFPSADEMTRKKPDLSAGAMQVDLERAGAAKDHFGLTGRDGIDMQLIDQGAAKIV